MFWVALVSIRNKVSACWRNPRGESRLSSHLLSSFLSPRTTWRLLEFKPGHVLAITPPQWPCWAQHLESHKKHYCPAPGIICPLPQRLREKQNVSPPTPPHPSSPTLRVLRRHIFQILPLLLATQPPSWYHIAPTLTYFPVEPTVTPTTEHSDERKTVWPKMLFCALKLNWKYYPFSAEYVTLMYSHFIDFWQ